MRVHIIGTGLLGASLGLALSAKGHQVTLEDTSPTAQQLAADLGAGQVVTPKATNAEAADPNTVIDELVALVRKEIGPVAAFKRVDIVSGLPKTRSGKILRKTMRQIADGENDPAVPSTIEDRSVLDDLGAVLSRS